MSVTIKKFDCAAAEVNRAYLIVGRKGTGKSTILFTLLKNLCTKIDYAFGMFGSRDGFERIKNSLPPDVLHRSFNATIFRNVINKLQQVSLRPGYSKITAAILDDLAYDRGTFRSNEMREAFMNGRWLGLLLMITQQYLLDIGPDLRGQIDYVFALGETSRKTRQKLYDYYFGVFNSFADFDRVFTQVTSKKGRALVLDNTISTTKITDRVFYFDGIVDLEGFVIGNDRFRSHLTTERTKKTNSLTCSSLKASIDGHQGRSGPRHQGRREP